VDSGEKGANPAEPRKSAGTDLRAGGFPLTINEGTMAKYFFHCTDGIDLALDRDGIECTDDDIFAEAQAASRRMMRALPASFDWSDWMVCVYDDKGRQVAAEPFPARQAPALPITRRRESATHVRRAAILPQHRQHARLSA
jgi:hypothetical protein